jgi:hypothetical protein
MDKLSIDFEKNGLGVFPQTHLVALAASRLMASKTIESHRWSSHLKPLKNHLKPSKPA